MMVTRRFHLSRLSSGGQEPILAPLGTRWLGVEKYAGDAAAVWGLVDTDLPCVPHRAILQSFRDGDPPPGPIMAGILDDVAPTTAVWLVPPPAEAKAEKIRATS